MTNRNCPECNRKVSLLTALNLCPSKTYTCPDCQEKLTISVNSHHILMVGFLFILLPAVVYCIIEPSVNSAIIVGLAFLILSAVTVATQKIIRVKA